MPYPKTPKKARPFNVMEYLKLQGQILSGNFGTPEIERYEELSAQAKIKENAQRWKTQRYSKWMLKRKSRPSLPH